MSIITNKKELSKRKVLCIGDQVYFYVRQSDKSLLCLGYTVQKDFLQLNVGVGDDLVFREIGLKEKKYQIALDSTLVTNPFPYYRDSIYGWPIMDLESQTRLVENLYERIEKRELNLFPAENETVNRFYWLDFSK